MQATIHTFNRLLDRLRLRYQRARRGSVMILVIALLVLMALIGTAFMTTVRTDRLSSTTHTYNTQIDLLVEGVIAMSRDSIVDTVLGTGRQFRPNDYAAWTSLESDPFLADRYPVRSTSTGQPSWTNISASPLATPANWTVQFTSPYNNESYGLVKKASPTRNGAIERTPIYAEPSSKTITYLGTNEIRVFPALKIGTAAPYLAADADGDGIADAGLFRLPIGTVNGVTYFAGLRIVDNAAAVNASIAIKPFETADAFPNAVRGNFFPTNIDLRSLLSLETNADNAMLDLLWYRMYGQIGNRPGGPLNGMYYATPFADNGLTPPGNPPDPSHPEWRPWEFSTVYENQWSQLGSRLDNPGYTGFSQLPPGTGLERFHPFSGSDAASMAYRFCLSSPEQGPSSVDRLLPRSMQSATVYRNPFQANDTTNWFASIFQYYDASNTPLPMPLRPMVVARNPVSTFVPSRLTARGAYSSSNTYAFGDWVPNPPGGNPDNHGAYVCIRPTNVVPGTDPNAWAPVSWASHPTKANVNTAGFGELWAAYWQVMKRTYGVTDNDIRADLARMFRSTLRPPDKSTVRFLGTGQMKKLRAALAAVNTIDMRDSGDEPTVRNITLAPSAEDQTNSVPVTVKIGGMEPQVFLTEVMVHDFGIAVPGDLFPFVILELYNPTDLTIDLSKFRLAQVPTPGGAMTTIGTLSGSVPPGGTMVVMSTRQPTKWPTDARTQTMLQELAPAALEMDALKNFVSQGTSELFLVRNLLSDPEGLPVDQVHFRGISAPRDQNEYRYHYARGTNPTAGLTGTAWHCAYSAADIGTYKYRTRFTVDPTSFDTYIRYAGWIQDTKRASNTPSPGVPNKLVDPATGFFKKPKGRHTLGVTGLGTTWGSVGSAAQATFVGRGVQLANKDRAGPNNPEQSNNPIRYPYGTFARDGDIMQAPFVGRLYHPRPGLYGGHQRHPRHCSRRGRRHGR